nr:GAPES1 domain-containing protein [Escherichia coli]
MQKADSSFLYDKYQNQSIAAHVMRALAAEQSEVSPAAYGGQFSRHW